MAVAEAALGTPDVGADGPWGVLVDTAELPDGGQLHLRRHEQDYEILFGDEQLMGSWAVRSEEALATLALRGLGPAPRVLIGGLGMGFTLAAARGAFPAHTSILVVELVPKIVTWATGILAPLFGGSLSDPRVTVRIQDVHDAIVEHAGSLDAILLDVDNGPDGLVSLANERLYCNWGLRSAYAALNPGGVLAVWSAFYDHDFTERLQDAGFLVDRHGVASGDPDDDATHVIWLATRPK